MHSLFASQKLLLKIVFKIVNALNVGSDDRNFVNYEYTFDLFVQALSCVELFFVCLSLQMRVSEMEMNKARNLIEHEEEILSRPARVWFQSKVQQKRNAGNKRLLLLLILLLFIIIIDIKKLLIALVDVMPLNFLREQVTAIDQGSVKFFLLVASTLTLFLKSLQFPVQLFFVNTQS